MYEGCEQNRIDLFVSLEKQYEKIECMERQLEKWMAIENGMRFWCVALNDEAARTYNRKSCGKTIKIEE